MVRKLRVKILALAILSFLVSPAICHAKGVATAPFIMAGTIEDMKIDSNQISFIFTGYISKSKWAKGDWELEASVTHLPVTVDTTFFFKEDDPMWGFRFEEQKEKALECINKTKPLEITIYLPIIRFSQNQINKLEGISAQIKGCGE